MGMALNPLFTGVGIVNQVAPGRVYGGRFNWRESGHYDFRPMRGRYTGAAAINRPLKSYYSATIPKKPQFIRCAAHQKNSRRH